MVGRLLLFLIILFSPTQLGKHFWGPFSQVGGFRLDYLSPTLYFTDALILLYTLINLPEIIKFLKRHFRPLLPLILFIFLNLLFSISPFASLFIWLRWLLYSFLILCLHLNHVKLKTIIYPLTISVTFIVLLEVIHLLTQASLGGVLYYLGERSFNQSTPQLAKMVINGRLLLRPYATFSHPNSLAGFLLISLFILRLKSSSELAKIISFVGIVLSFSKTAIVTTVLYLLGFFKKNRLLLVLTLPLLIFLIKPLIDSSESLSNRFYLLSPTLNIIWQYPLFGVGLGGFFSALVNVLPENQITPSLIQPVHNIFLLFVAETGVLGLLILGYYTIKAKVLRHPRLIELISLFLLTGGFDHYWITLPQNKLILFLALFFVYNRDQ